VGCAVRGALVGAAVAVAGAGAVAAARGVDVAAGEAGVAVGAAGRPQASVTANARSAIGARRAMLSVLSQNTEKR